MVTVDFGRQLSEAARLNGFVTDAESLIKFTLYRDELVKWGRVINLSSRLTDRDIIYTHFIDSMIYLHGLSEKSGQMIADIGSGAGFPGVPMAIMRPDCNFDLIEPRQKRATFLNYIKRILDLGNVNVINDRVENISETNRYDAIVTRALLNPEELHRQTENLLAGGGRLIISMGPTYAEKIHNIRIPLNVQKYEIHGENVDRWLIILISESVPRGTV